MPAKRGHNLQISFGKTRNAPHLPALIDDITRGYEGPRDPLRGVVGLQSKTSNEICEKLL